MAAGMAASLSTGAEAHAQDRGHDVEPKAEVMYTIEGKEYSSEEMSAHVRLLRDGAYFSWEKDKKNKDKKIDEFVHFSSEALDVGDDRAERQVISCVDRLWEKPELHQVLIPLVSDVTLKLSAEAHGYLHEGKPIDVDTVIALEELDSFTYDLKTHTQPGEDLGELRRVDQKIVSEKLAEVYLDYQLSLDRHTKDGDRPFRYGELTTPNRSLVLTNGPDFDRALYHAQAAGAETYKDVSEKILEKYLTDLELEKGGSSIYWDQISPLGWVGPKKASEPMAQYFTVREGLDVLALAVSAGWSEKQLIDRLTPMKTEALREEDYGAVMTVQGLMKQVERGDYAVDLDYLASNRIELVSGPHSSPYYEETFTY